MLVAAHQAIRVVFVAIDHVTLLCGDIEKRQQMAARCRGHKRFLWIDRCLHGERQPHDLRRGGGRHGYTTVEPPLVAPAVLVVAEYGVASPPGHSGLISMHLLPPSSRPWKYPR